MSDSITINVIQEGPTNIEVNDTGENIYLNPVTLNQGIINHSVTHQSGGSDELLHNLLGGLYGGTSGQYYHLSSGQYFNLTTGDVVRPSETGAFYPRTNPSGFITGVDLSNYATIPFTTGISGYIQGQVNILNSQTGQYVLTGSTGDFYPRSNPSGYITGVDLSGYVTGEVVRPSQTGDFITTGQTGDFYPKSNPSGFITGVDLSPYATVAFVTGVSGELHSQIENVESQITGFVTGDVVRPSQTGNFITTAQTGDFYPRSNPSGFITGVDLSGYVTGEVVRPSQTGDFYPRSNPSGFITGVDLSNYATIPYVTGISGDLNNKISNIASGTGQFYLASNPSGFITGVDLTPYATISFTTGISGSLQNQITTLNNQTGQYVLTGSTGSFITQSQTGQFYAASNPSGFITGVDLSNYATIGFTTGISGSLQQSISNLESHTGDYYPRTNPSGYITGIPNIVYTTGDQDISGLKDFQTRPTVTDIPVLLSGEAVDLVHLYGKNDAGQTIYRGQPVYIYGANGANPLIRVASNTGEGTSSKTIGLMAQDVLPNAFGFVVSEGMLEGFDTSSGQAGDAMWLGTTGDIIYGLANKPYGNNHLVYLGNVLRSSVNNGKVYIKVQNGFEISELHKVYAQSPEDKHSLIYDSGSGAWFSRAIGTGDISGLNNYSTIAYVTGVSGNLQNEINTIENTTGSFYLNSNPSGYITGINDIVYTTGDQNISGAKAFQSLSVSETVSITGNLTVDTNVLFVNTSTNRVGINTINPTVTLEVSGQIYGLNDVNCGINQSLGWANRARMYSPTSSTGIIGLYNNAVNNFDRLQFGGTGSAFPSLKRVGAGFAVRTADDSADSTITASNIVVITGAQTIAGAKTFSDNIVGNGTANRLPNQTATTSDAIMTRKLVDEYPFLAPFQPFHDFPLNGGWSTNVGTFSSITQRPDALNLRVGQSLTGYSMAVAGGLQISPLGSVTSTGYARVDWSGRTFIDVVFIMAFGLTTTPFGQYRGTRNLFALGSYRSIAGADTAGSGAILKLDSVGVMTYCDSDTTYQTRLIRGDSTGASACVITDASNASPIVITTSATNGLVTGDRIEVRGVGGNTNANGFWTVTRLTGTTFSLDGSSGNAAYTTGGTWHFTSNVLYNGTVGQLTRFTVSVSGGVATLFVNGNSVGTLSACPTRNNGADASAILYGDSHGVSGVTGGSNVLVRSFKIGALY